MENSKKASATVMQSGRMVDIKESLQELGRKVNTLSKTTRSTGEYLFGSRPTLNPVEHIQECGDGAIAEIDSLLEALHSDVNLLNEIAEELNQTLGGNNVT